MKKGKQFNWFYLFILLFGILNFVNAQEVSISGIDGEKSADATEDLADEENEETSALEVSGFVDAYYQYSFNESPFPTSFTETHNSFTPGMANVVLAKTTGKVGFVADVAVGPRAELSLIHI